MASKSAFNKMVINKIKTAPNTSNIMELNRVLTDPDFNIYDYETLIDDKDRFLNKEINTRSFDKISVNSFIMSNINTFPNKQQILDFFGKEKPFELSEINAWTDLIFKLNSGDYTIDRLNQLRIKLAGKIYNKNQGTPFYTMFNYYSSHIKSLYGDRPDVGKWTLTFSDIIIDSDNFLNLDKGRIKLLGLDLLIALSNPISPYLNNPIYISFFEVVLQYVLYTLGTNIMNMTPIAKSIVRIINDMIGYTYIILNCKNGLGSYTCGRAVSSIHKMPEEKIPRLVIFNTNSSEDDNLDSNYYKTLVTDEENKLNLENGGDRYYYKNKYLKYNETELDQMFYKKYLKYKQKYLDLKKSDQNL